jgi:putative NADH-flavin reductase
MSVEFQARHRSLLEKALKSLGWKWTETSKGLVVGGLGTLDLENGVAEVLRTEQSKLNQLKQQYSKQALRRAAKLQGWQLKAKGRKGVLRR